MSFSARLGERRPGRKIVEMSEIKAPRRPGGSEADTKSGEMATLAPKSNIDREGSLNLPNEKPHMRMIKLAHVRAQEAAPAGSARKQSST